MVQVYYSLKTRCLNRRNRVFECRKNYWRKRHWRVSITNAVKLSLTCMAPRPRVGSEFGARRGTAGPLPFQGFPDQGEQTEHLARRCLLDEPSEQSQAEPGHGVG
ncbi:MAG: hypothetical protein PHG00_14915 [Methylococcales bacterium]|nr:hypothetical protein [Methylococcales bacterium]